MRNTAGHRATCLTAAALLLSACGSSSTDATTNSQPPISTATTNSTTTPTATQPNGDELSPLPAPTAPPLSGGWTLEETLPFWDPTKDTPQASSAAALERIARERNWTQHTEPGEPEAITYLTDTDAAVNLVTADNDSGTLGQLAPDPHIPHFQGGSSTDLLKPSKGYLDNGYHFPPQEGSWLAWKIKYDLTPGGIRSFRYRVASGPAPAWQMAIRQRGVTFIARYTPPAGAREVTVPIDDITPEWELLYGNLTSLGTGLTWNAILNWPAPSLWDTPTLRDAPITPATEPMPAANGDPIFLPGDPSGIRLISTSDKPSHITMLEFGFHWPHNKRDYLQIRSFPTSNAR